MKGQMNKINKSVNKNMQNKENMNEKEFIGIFRTMPNIYEKPSTVIAKKVYHNSFTGS